MRPALRPCVTTGAAVVAAAVIAVTPMAPVSGTPPRAYIPGIQLTAGDDPDIVIEFVRHAQTDPPDSVAQAASQGLPGFPLTELGQQQAQEIGDALFKDLGPVAGIFGGYEQRMVETADPFDKLEGMTMQPLYGFNEIAGGIFTDAVPGSLGGELSNLPAAWVFGLLFAPNLGSNDYNGVQFDDNVDNAIDTAYQAALANPVVSANGHITDVVFSGDGMISAWTAMNAKNPDLAIGLPVLLKGLSSGTFDANAGKVVIEGNPTDGWTLINFDGQAFPENPGLVSELFADARNLVEAPQIAAWDLFQAAFNGVSATIGGAPVELHFTTVAEALESAVKNVGTAVVEFPGSMAGDVVASVRDLGADVAAGETFKAAFDSAILGLPG